jgi:hypothetical protein
MQAAADFVDAILEADRMAPQKTESTRRIVTAAVKEVLGGHRREEMALYQQFFEAL